ncbi:MAG: hypothetical protein PUF49_05110 [Firmicutes bacterium]|nr:hypothetical protein [Bacillota bacterium]
MITEAQKKATKRYNDKSAQIAIRVPPEKKKAWEDYAESHKMSLRALIIAVMDEHTSVQ